MGKRRDRREAYNICDGRRPGFHRRRCRVAGARRVCGGAATCDGEDGDRVGRGASSAHPGGEARRPTQPLWREGTRTRRDAHESPCEHNSSAPHAWTLPDFLCSHGPNPKAGPMAEPVGPTDRDGRPRTALVAGRRSPPSLIPRSYRRRFLQSPNPTTSDGVFLRPPVTSHAASTSSLTEEIAVASMSSLSAASPL